MGIPTRCSTSPQTETTIQVGERAWKAATVRAPAYVAYILIVTTKELVGFWRSTLVSTYKWDSHWFRSSGPGNLRRVRRFYDLEVTTYA